MCGDTEHGGSWYTGADMINYCSAEVELVDVEAALPQLLARLQDDDAALRDELAPSATPA